jgi:hypothetical protein
MVSTMCGYQVNVLNVKENAINPGVPGKSEQGQG